MRDRLLQYISATLAVVACGLAAWAVSLVHWDPQWRALVPFAFLAVVLGLGALYGRMVGMLGSIVSALVFARSLYPPLGSLAVQEPASRSTLAWMLLAGVALSFLLLPPSRTAKK
jgi:K+-sensing histidine kinase KdpD